jgi:hypothetical protein
MIIDKEKKSLILCLSSEVFRQRADFGTFQFYRHLTVCFCANLNSSSSNLLRAADKHRSALPELLLEKYTSRGILSWRISHLLCAARRLLTPPKSAPRCATSSEMIENPLQKLMIQTIIQNFRENCSNGTAFKIKLFLELIYVTI